MITQESIMKARQWFADNAQACIDEAANGSVMVNNFEEYKEWRESQIVEYLNGVWDHTFTFQQRAYYIQTGESVPLLP